MNTPNPASRRRTWLRRIRLLRRVTGELTAVVAALSGLATALVTLVDHMPW